MQNKNVIEQNQAEVVNRGRAPNAAILEQWAGIIQLKIGVVQLFERDASHWLNCSMNLTIQILYSQALNVMQSRVDEVDETLSA